MKDNNEEFRGFVVVPEQKITVNVINNTMTAGVKFEVWPPSCKKEVDGVGCILHDGHDGDCDPYRIITGTK